MSVSIIENWTDIRGRVIGLQAEGGIKNFSLVEIQVTATSPVAGFANLLEGMNGQTIALYVPAALARARGLQVGSLVDCRVRRGGPTNLFVHPEMLSTV